MPDGTALNPDDFWQFSLGHYARAGVESACLKLQNHYRGNVNLALLLHWLDDQQVRLSDKAIEGLINTTCHSDILLSQYRAMRKKLKPQLDHDGYQQLLRFELTLEKQQQGHLITWLNDHSQHLTAQSPDADNLSRYCLQLRATALLEALQGRNGY